MKTYLFLFISAFLLFSCGEHEKKINPQADATPVIGELGKKITFANVENMRFFETENVVFGEMRAELIAPCKVSATTIRSGEGAGQNIVLFENPALSDNYSALIKHLINIRQQQNIILQKQSIIQLKNIELARYKDLADNGVGTGKDLSTAKTELILAETDLKITENDLNNEKAGIIEHEATLKTEGFDPSQLRNGSPGTAYLICSIPESQITKVSKGTTCSIEFMSFPREKFTGQIDDIAETIDNVTRMVKLRISLNNADNRLKAGMFATAYFGINEGNNLSIKKDALITVQGKNYVFVKKSDTAFERREVKTGVQINDRILVYEGLQKGENVAVKGAIQLKGLSFGY